MLRSGWWRNTTADALMIGRQAYGYVVWQHGTPQTLRSLLDGGRPATSVGAQARRLPDWWRTHRAASRETGPGPEQAIGADPGPYPDDVPGSGTYDAGISPLEQPANVLALQRSGTGRQSLTFAVFRDEPKAD